MCNRIATSKEHVPPKCVFPEMKDLKIDLRKNLITVPSCDIHNSKKSNDDEFQMVCLAGIIGNNSIGYKHKFSKVNRAIINSSGKLLEEAFTHKKLYEFGSDNNFYKIIWGTPDNIRLLKCFEKNSYALYRHHFNKRFFGEIKVFLGYLYYHDQNDETLKNFIKHKISIELKDKPKFGSNPDIFYYQFTDKDEFGIFSLKMCFYGGVEIFSAFIPSDSNYPKTNFPLMLINGGIRTIIELEDKQYEFN